MSDFRIPDGKYEARVIDYGVSQTKAGDPQVMVKFKLVLDGSEITWFGSLKEGRPQEITFDTLQRVLAMQGDDLDALNGGSGSGILDEKKVVMLVIASEEYQGKLYTRVKWVNEIGQPVKKNLDRESIQKLKSLNAAFKARRKETGAKSPARDEELPF
jgi:hypothetical protein